MASVEVSHHGAEGLLDGDGRVYRGWKATLAGTMGLAVGPSAICVLCFGVFAPFLQQAFGWSVAATSLGATILSVMIMLVSPLQGILVDRIGARPLILCSIPLFGMGVAAMALQSGALWQFYLAWLVIPLLGVGLWPGAYVKVTSGWFDRRLGLAIAVATIGIGIGGALLPLVISSVADAFSWREAYIALGLGAVAISWPAAYFFIHERDRSKDAPVQGAASDWRTGVRTPAFTRLAIGFSMLGLVSSGMLVHQVGILIGNGLDVAEAIRLQAVLGLATIAGRLLAGWLLDRVHVRVVMPLFALAALAALLALTLGATGTGAVICAATVGMLIGGEIDVLGYVAKRYFGLTSYTTFYGILFSVFQLGGALGVMLVGALHHGTGGFTPGLVVMQLACLVAAGAFAALGPYKTVTA